MKLLKPFSEFSQADKTMLLHILFPEQIKSFLSFVEWRIADALKDPEDIVANWDSERSTLTPEKWMELLVVVKQDIQSRREVLYGDAIQFTALFSTGYIQGLFLDCMREYTYAGETEEDIIKAIEFLFGL